uniref:Uncharacterized protein LOC103955926 n=1 Tax=Rhizophora mucronata TaxID=61149 RepID=A0A2P2MKF4_RHIMU
MILLNLGVKINPTLEEYWNQTSQSHP